MESSQTADQFWSPRLIFGLITLFSLIYFNLLYLRWDTLPEILQHRYLSLHPFPQTPLSLRLFSHRQSSAGMPWLQVVFRFAPEPRPCRHRAAGRQPLRPSVCRPCPGAFDRGDCAGRGGRSRVLRRTGAAALHQPGTPPSGPPTPSTRQPGDRPPAGALSPNCSQAHPAFWHCHGRHQRPPIPDLTPAWQPLPADSPIRSPQTSRSACRRYGGPGHSAHGARAAPAKLLQQELSSQPAKDLKPNGFRLVKNLQALCLGVKYL